VLLHNTRLVSSSKLGAGVPHHLAREALRPPVASLPVSAVEQIGDHGPVVRSRDASQKHGADELQECRIMRRLGEQGGAGDDLAAGEALAVTQRPPCRFELVTSGKLTG